jgi:hypothetical protein
MVTSEADDLLAALASMGCAAVPLADLSGLLATIASVGNARGASRRATRSTTSQAALTAYCPLRRGRTDRTESMPRPPTLRRRGLNAEVEDDGQADGVVSEMSDEKNGIRGKKLDRESRPRGGRPCAGMPTIPGGLVC